MDNRYLWHNLLCVLQGAVQAGHVKIPPGCHPIDVEKEWGRLHVAILERERLLRTEFERYACYKLRLITGLCYFARATLKVKTKS